MKLLGYIRLFVWLFDVFAVGHYRGRGLSLRPIGCTPALWRTAPLQLHFVVLLSAMPFSTLNHVFKHDHCLNFSCKKIVVT